MEIEQPYVHCIEKNDWFKYLKAKYFRISSMCIDHRYAHKKALMLVGSQLYLSLLHQIHIIGLFCAFATRASSTVLPRQGAGPA